MGEALAQAVFALTLHTILVIDYLTYQLNNVKDCILIQDE